MASTKTKSTAVLLQECDKQKSKALQILSNIDFPKDPISFKYPQVFITRQEIQIFQKEDEDQTTQYVLCSTYEFSIQTETGLQFKSDSMKDLYKKWVDYCREVSMMQAESDKF